MKIISKTIILVTCSICFFSCVKMPKNRPFYSEVIYSFKGESDMTSLFNYTAEYLDANHQFVHEEITSLPWSKSISVAVPFDAKLRVIFSKKTNIPEQEIYRVGFSGSVETSSAAALRETKTNSKISGSKFDTLKFNIILPEAGLWPEDINITIPALKYNKHFAFSYTADDAPVGAYARFWRRVNKKWIDNVEFFHMGCTPTQGYIPENTLGYTDGCGNERRFPIGVAIWPNVSNEYQPDGLMEDSSNSRYLPYITWEELIPILDFGGSVYYHDIDGNKYDTRNPEEIVQGLADDKTKTMQKLGRKMKILSLPNGNKAYLQAVELSSDVVFTRTDISSSEHPTIWNLNNIRSLYKERLYNGFEDNIQKKLEELTQQAQSENPYWVSFSTHRLSEELIPFFEAVNNLFGKDGEDNIWFTTLEEMYEYVTLRNSAVIKKTTGEKRIEYKIILPSFDNFYYKDLSFILSGIPDGCIVEAGSKNIVGISCGRQQNGYLLNINYNENAVRLAEKYTSLFEKTLKESDKEDALYFISFLLPDLARPYMERITNVNMYPVILKEFDINNGDEVTYDRKVQISMSLINTPLQYRIGETGDLSDAIWKAYEGNVMDYILSAGFGNKNIYVQLRDNLSESKIISSKIEYRDVPQKGEIPKNAINHYIEKYHQFIFECNRKIEKN